MTRRVPTVAVWRFASCDGCQLSLLDLEDELLELAGAIAIEYFLAQVYASPEYITLRVPEAAVCGAGRRGGCSARRAIACRR